MLTDSREPPLVALAQAFDCPGTFYILGAGASYPITPLTSGLAKTIIRRYLNHPLHPALGYKSSAIANTILSQFAPPGWRDGIYFRRWIEVTGLSGLSESAISVMLLRELNPCYLKVRPDQYQVFKLAMPATIFTFNYDGLARSLAPPHLVIEPHGTLPRGICRTQTWSNIIDIAIESGIEKDWLPLPIQNLQYPEPEPKTITRSLAYSKASDSLIKATHIVCIGYSFGSDDFESTSFLIDHIKRRRVHLTIVDKEPERIADIFGVACCPRKCALLGVAWNHLSKSIVELIRSRRVRHPSDIPRMAHLVLRRCDELEGEIQPELSNKIRCGRGFEPLTANNALFGLIDDLRKRLDS